MIPTPRAGFVAGVGAGALTALGMLGPRVGVDSPPLAGLLADKLTFFVPLPLFDAIIGLLGSAAKRLFFASVVIGMILVAGLLGAMAARRGLGVGDGIKWLVGLWLATAVLGLTSLGAGSFGSLTRQGPVVTSLALAACFAVYGGALYGLARLFRAAPAAADVDPLDVQRRRFLRLAGLGGLVMVGGAVGLWQLVESLARRTGGAVTVAMAQGLAKLPSEITPVDEFYSVSKNFFSDPTVDGPSWRLEIGGSVERPYAISYEDLRALPAVEDMRTLMCISNEVGGNLIGNASWRGVRLRDLLERAAPAAGAYKVIFI